MNIKIGIKGAGEMSSAVACRLFMANMRNIVMMEIPHPRAVRRGVSFCEALYEGNKTVEGIEAVKADTVEEIRMAWANGKIAVVTDPKWTYIEKIKPDVIIDAILAKKNLGTFQGEAPVVIGLGPGFDAGMDVDFAIETNRGHNLGRIITKGRAEPNTGIPGSISGYAAERVLRAPVKGVFNTVRTIGDTVKAGDLVGGVNGADVRTVVSGVIRGLIRPGSEVSEGLKLGDIDPRGNKDYCNTISDKARAIAGSVLEAVLRGKFETGNWKLETGNWKLETGNWKLETGNWKLETRNSELETWNSKLETRNSKISERVLRGEKQAVAKAINIVENKTDDYVSLLDHLYRHTGKAHRIGITGPPGSGKSTLTNQLIKIFRSSGLTVGVIAVDPSSPFTGGAIFGDRLRMNDIVSDPGVFIRSMATRGSLGGLARQAAEVADILDASGKDIIICETVGVGQIELDVMSAADTIVVVTVPDAGDVIQAMKAGLMEIGDIFIVNKADLSGAEQMKSDIEYVLQLKESKNNWQPNVRMTESKKGAGIHEVFNDINAHLLYLTEHGILQDKRNQQVKERVRILVNEHIADQFWTEERLKIITDCIKSENRVSPYAIAEKLLSW
ncbi:MAG: EF2563 family selenium-dependent molybdenum hydroxylase system protein [Desulfobacterales bacterium]|nr:EF2563 family selenium-dependent molybdenum hydroxylase system protein [Desulfobacterales bacterium]